MAIRLAVLASTSGTDMGGLIEAISRKELDAEIVCCISNKECGALERARNNGIEAILIEPADKDREAFDREVAGEIDKRDIGLILLIGYMRILSPWFVKKYENKVMNIHPSLLPAFAGGMDKNVHEEVLKHGCKVTGCTLHFITEEADEGPIIIQKAVQIEEGDTPDMLKPKVQKKEVEAFIEAISLFQQGRLKVEGRVVKDAKFRH